MTSGALRGAQRTRHHRPVRIPGVDAVEPRLVDAHGAPVHGQLLGKPLGQEPGEPGGQHGHLGDAGRVARERHGIEQRPVGIRGIVRYRERDDREPPRGVGEPLDESLRVALRLDQKRRRGKRDAELRQLVPLGEPDDEIRRLAEGVTDGGQNPGEEAHRLIAAPGDADLVHRGAGGPVLASVLQPNRPDVLFAVLHPRRFAAKAVALPRERPLRGPLGKPFAGPVLHPLDDRGTDSGRPGLSAIDRRRDAQHLGLDGLDRHRGEGLAQRGERLESGLLHSDSLRQSPDHANQ